MRVESGPIKVSGSSNLNMEILVFEYAHNGKPEQAACR